MITIRFGPRIALVAFLGLGAGVTLSSALAQETITLRIASGHPPAVVYAGLMQDYFQPELKKRVEERTDYTINWVDGYGGSIVKVFETLEGVQNGIVDIGGYCFCFEPSNLPLHAFQVMVPFGPSDPIESLRVAQAVYAEVPYLTEVFEDKFNQKLLARITDANYNLGTTFPWKTLDDLKGRRVAGAGLNLNWLEHAGITPVATSLPESYTSLITGLYDGFIMFPSAWVNLKLYEPARYYTLINFGTIVWHGLTINSDKWESLPAEVQEIMIETARDFEEEVGKVNRKRYGEDIEKLRELINVNEIAPEVRRDWAAALKDWPQEMANELNGKGLAASKVLNLTLEVAEKRGHKWPYRYEIE